jgi:hypothetical protein
MEDIAISFIGLDRCDIDGKVYIRLRKNVEVDVKKMSHVGALFRHIG